MQKRKLALNIIKSKAGAYETAEAIYNQLAEGEAITLNTITFERNDIYLLITMFGRDKARFVACEAAELILWPNRRELNDSIRSDHSGAALPAEVVEVEVVEVARPDGLSAGAIVCRKERPDSQGEILEVKGDRAFVKWAYIRGPRTWIKLAALAIYKERTEREKLQAQLDSARRHAAKRGYTAEAIRFYRQEVKRLEVALARLEEEEVATAAVVSALEAVQAALPIEPAEFEVAIAETPAPETLETADRWRKVADRQYTYRGYSLSKSAVIPYSYPGYMSIQAGDQAVGHFRSMQEAKNYIDKMAAVGYTPAEVAGAWFDLSPMYFIQWDNRDGGRYYLYKQLPEVVLFDGELTWQPAFVAIDVSGGLCFSASDLAQKNGLRITHYLGEQFVCIEAGAHRRAWDKRLMAELRDRVGLSLISFRDAIGEDELEALYKDFAEDPEAAVDSINFDEARFNHLFAF
jgi:hypothetical protein